MVILREARASLFLWHSEGKKERIKMGKSKLLKKIHSAAINYQKHLAGRTFLYVYEDRYVEIVFKSSSFLHLTGVKTNLKAKGFFLHAKKKKGLRPSEVMFDKTHPYDLAERKINHLENLYKVTCTNVMIATEIVTITAIYKIGVTNFQFVLLCGPNRDKTGTLIDDCLVPYSFRVEDISTSRFEELYEVKYIFSKQTNEKNYSTVTYKSEDSISDLPDNIREKVKNI